MPEGMRTLTESEALELVRQGSSETVEVRGPMTSARIVADLIAGFAHHRGGHIIFGFHRGRKRVVGCNPTRLKRRHEEAEALLDNSQLSSISFYQVHGRQLGVISVGATSRLVVSPGGLLVWNGFALRAMPRSRVVEMAQKMRTPMSFDDYVAMLVRMQHSLTNTGELMCRNSSWPRKIQENIIGFVIGAALSAALTYAVAKLRARPS